MHLPLSNRACHFLSALLPRPALCHALPTAESHEGHENAVAKASAPSAAEREDDVVEEGPKDLRLGNAQRLNSKNTAPAVLGETKKQPPWEFELVFGEVFFQRTFDQNDHVPKRKDSSVVYWGTELLFHATIWVPGRNDEETSESKEKQK